MRKKKPATSSIHKSLPVKKQEGPEKKTTPPPPLPQESSVIQPSPPQTPEEWRAHWQAQGQSWRTEPEIDSQRQEELAKCRAITPDIEKGIYPFSGMKLTRADIEWLLVTHENGRGPVDWSDENQRERRGLDLRGADLRGGVDQSLDLSGLPLARLICGLNIYEEGRSTTEEQRERAGTLLTGTDLGRVQLTAANLSHAQLKRANLTEAQLERANLSGAWLEEANLYKAQLTEADFHWAQLMEANLNEAQLERANLTGAHLERAGLREAQLERANLTGAHLERANLFGAQLKGAAFLMARVEKADLRQVQLDSTILNEVKLADNDHIGPYLADIQWGVVSLTVADWSQIAVLSDEHEARQQYDSSGNRKNLILRLSDYKAAVRANRQLSVALQAQGLNEDAARFAYRAQVLQKTVYRLQMILDSKTQNRTQPLRSLGSWLFSWFLFLLAGYGYKPLRSFLAYVLVIAGFATTYYLLGQYNYHLPGPHLSWYEALVVSMTAFHGRGFFAGTFSPGDPQALVAAIEAFFGLLIEVTFIATLTQRLFSR